MDLEKPVTVGRLIELAGQLNEEIRVGDESEYTRGQVNLIADAAGLTVDEQGKVEAAIAAASDRFYRGGAPCPASA